MISVCKRPKRANDAFYRCQIGGKKRSGFVIYCLYFPKRLYCVLPARLVYYQRGWPFLCKPGKMTKFSVVSIKGSI